MNNKFDKYVVFKISDCLMALPMDSVLRIINTPPIDSGWNTMGLIQVGNYTIRIINLHPHFNTGVPLSLAARPSFLVITNPIEGELCGIIVDEPPNLIELNRDVIHKLPKSNRQLQMVSHAAIIYDQEIKTTIFMLDLHQLLNPVG